MTSFSITIDLQSFGVLKRFNVMTFAHSVRVLHEGLGVRGDSGDVTLLLAFSKRRARFSHGQSRLCCVLTVTWYTLTWKM